MIPKPIFRTPNRFENALMIQSGACNGAAIAGSLHQAYREAREEYRDTDRTNRDPAVQMILHQLCHLGRISTDDYSHPSGFRYDRAYRECVDRCQSYRTLVLLGEADRACIFVCDSPHYDV